MQLLNVLAEDQLSSALIPSEEKGVKALQTTGDGNCLYNSASVLIEGDQSFMLDFDVVNIVQNPLSFSIH